MARGEGMKEETNPMNCFEFNAIVPDLGRPGAVNAEVSAAALAHAESCGRCAVLLTETESLEFALRKLASRDADLQAPARVEEALLREFRRTRKIPARRAVRWKFAAAAAAVLLLAAGVSLRQGFLHPPSSRSETGLAFNSVQSSPVVASPLDTPAAKPAMKSAMNPNNAAKAQTPVQFVGAVSQEAFMALPYADDPEMLEGGAIVRVNLSREALASFGLPVSEVGDAEQIPADVVLSPDGTPEAVRLVSLLLPAENVAEK